MAFAGNDGDLDALGCLQLGELIVLKVPVPGRFHLFTAVQVQPELKAFHHAIILLWDFGVDYAFACGHPLHATVLQQSFMPGAVSVQHAPGDHVSHGFKAPVRMVRKTGNVVVGLVAAKGIKHQKRVEAVLQVLGEHAVELDTCAIRGGLAGDQALDRT